MLPDSPGAGSLAILVAKDWINAAEGEELLVNAVDVSMALAVREVEPRAQEGCVGLGVRDLRAD